MPLLNGPNALVDTIKTTAINFLIGRIALTGLGKYSLAWQLTMGPASLIQGAVAQVLLQRMSIARPGELTPLVRQLLIRVSLIAVPMFGVYYLIAPGLFELLFGNEWVEAGSLARGLMPWVAMLTATSPLSNVFIVVEKQQWLLMFALLYAAAPIVFLATTKMDLVWVVSLLGILMAGLLVLQVVLAIVVARKFDRQGGDVRAEQNPRSVGDWRAKCVISDQS